MRRLQTELKALHRDEKMEGVTISVPDETDLFTWEIGIFGPPETIYEGGYFKCLLAFPKDYPMSPPEMRFTCGIWHPNVYPDGKVCISILHPPGEDAQSGERPEERWNPAQSVRTILLSVISLLNEPNISSPANVDASVAYRKWKEGKDDLYQKRVAATVEESKAVALDEGVDVPTTIEDYVLQAEPEGGGGAMEEDDFDDEEEFDEADFESDSDDDGEYGVGSDGEEAGDDPMDGSQGDRGSPDSGL